VSQNRPEQPAGRTGGQDAGPQGYRGQRLGLPPTGKGSLAPFGRRLAAIFIDWICSLLVVGILVPVAPWVRTPSGRGLATLLVFGVEVALLGGLAGASFGQRLLGIGVVGLDRGRMGLRRSVVRTVLLCLAVPALIWDRDGRGLHDRAVNTAVVRLA
jgi:uncharacterized RDD family membrane protein YckC